MTEAFWVPVMEKVSPVVLMQFSEMDVCFLAYLWLRFIKCTILLTEMSS